jgi:uncharacterized LabA/DUF88 family protein
MMNSDSSRRLWAANIMQSTVSTFHAEQARKYAFIDSRHILTYYDEALRKWFPEPAEIDFARLINSLGAGKSFYYDCIDNLRRSTETDADYATRLEVQYSYLNRVRKARGCHIRLGVLKGNPKRKVKRQKEIDVLIAVDMLTHAAQKNMNTAILVTGDQDLKPAVESLVQLGVFVEVYGDGKHTSRELSWASSAYRKLTFDDYFQMSTETLIQKYPIPTRPAEIRQAPGTHSQIGKVGDYTVELLNTTSPADYAIRVQPTHDAGSVFAHNQAERLKLYADIVLGEIQWQEQRIA